CGAERSQMGGAGVLAATGLLKNLVAADAFLGLAVEIVVESKPCFRRAVDEGLRGKIILAQFLDADRSAAAMQRACAARIVFGASEIGQHVPPAPAIATQSLPAVIVLRLPANLHHRVHAAPPPHPPT